MSKHLPFVLLMAILSMSAPALAGESIKDIIQKREDQWSAAYNANDADALGAFYVDDAVLVPPGSPPVHGRAAIQEALAGLFPGLKDIKLIADDVRAMGEDYAVEVGRAEMLVVGEDGSTTPTTSDYVVVWHKGADGVWRYMTDIFNAHGS